MEIGLEIIFSILLGLGLATACGFKVFIPFLIISIASMSGHIELNDNFMWLASKEALITLVVASVLEILAYYIPYVDNLLDTVSAPVAMIGGTIIMSSTLQGMSPLMTWTLAAIAGGTVAGATSVATSSTRVASTATTGGVGNNIINTTEIIMSTALSALPLIFPIIGLMLLIITLAIFAFVLKKLKRMIFPKKLEES